MLCILNRLCYLIIYTIWYLMIGVLWGFMSIIGVLWGFIGVLWGFMSIIGVLWGFMCAFVIMDVLYNDA